MNYDMSGIQKIEERLSFIIGVLDTYEAKASTLTEDDWAYLDFLSYEYAYLCSLLA